MIFIIGWKLIKAESKTIDHLRVRQITVVDENEKERIYIASPVPDSKDGVRKNSSTGIVINDADGWERFGLGVRQDGSVGMGFDARPGVGDPRNRERMTFNVFPDGVAEWRVLDDSTRVKARLITDDRGDAFLQFIEWSVDKPVILNLGVKELKQFLSNKEKIIKT